MLELTEVSGHCLEGELGTAGGSHELATLRTDQKEAQCCGVGDMQKGGGTQSPQMSFSPDCLCPTM